MTNQGLVETSSMMIGQFGGKAITGTDAVTPLTGAGRYFYAIQAIADTVVAAQGNVQGSNNVDLTAFTSIAAGTIIYGRFNSITLTSGEAIGYYGR